MKELRKIIAVICAVSLAAVSGCGTEQKPALTAETAQAQTDAQTTAAASADTTANQTGAPEDTEKTDETAAETPLTAESIVSSMTLEQKIAQMIMISFQYWTDFPDTNENAGERQDVLTLNDKQRAVLEKYGFGGICIYTGNISGTEQTVRLTADMQAAAAKSEHGIPMFIAADQEGGEITRISTGTKTCGNMALGATGDTQAAYDNAAIMGAELDAVGINTDFGPVLDVNCNPANPVINVRSFSSDPRLAASLGKAYIEGLESKGVITVAKHFPGHGDTDTDSHTGMPVIDKSPEELWKMELIPFAELADDADMIMTAHIQFPQIETQTYTSVSSGEEILLPATLSRTVITDMLRSELGYDGVVVTDAMLMDAIDANFDPIDAAVLAINADVDMILEPLCIVNDESIDAIGKYISDIADAVKSGRIPVEEIDDSVVRIVSLKLEKGLFGSSDIDVEEAVAAAKAVVGSKENHDKELEIAEKAVTLVKNDNDTLPLRMRENEKIMYFYPFDGEQNTMTFALGRLKAQGIVPESVTADCHTVKERPAAEYADDIADCAAVILAVETYKTQNMDATSQRGWQAVFADELISTAHALGKKVVLLSMHMPYDAARYSAADAVLCAYCGQDMPVIPTSYNGETKAYGVNYPAALITVFGGSSPTGTLPVELPEYIDGAGYTGTIIYPAGHGLNYADG